MNELVAEAKRLANVNYSTWGQWVVETMTDAEIAELLEDCNNDINEFVDLRIRVAGYYNEIESTAW